MFKVRGRRFKEDLRDKHFTSSTVGIWNQLPEEVEEAGTATMFKKHLD